MTQAGTVYGEALYDLAKSEQLDAEILQQLQVLQDAFREAPDFLRLLASPNLSKPERCGVLDDSFRGKLHPYVLNFLKILTEKGYPKHFPDCVEAYRAKYNENHGILPVTAVTAVALTPEQTQRLTKKLTELTGKAIDLHNRVDPDVLGGIRLDYSGKRLDDTVSHRLDALRALLKNTVL